MLTHAAFGDRIPARTGQSTRRPFPVPVTHLMRVTPHILIGGSFFVIGEEPRKILTPSLRHTAASGWCLGCQEAFRSSLMGGFPEEFGSSEARQPRGPWPCRYDAGAQRPSSTSTSWSHRFEHRFHLLSAAAQPQTGP